MTFRYFRAVNDSVYEQARGTLDATWGYPTADGDTVTSFTPASLAPHDNMGRPYLQVREEFCSYEAVSVMLAGAIGSGDVEEITAGQFDDVCQSSV